MSLLIELRHRIKTIETIKKITHAMRLISMSSRSRLKSKEDPLREYIKASTQILLHIKAHAPDWSSPLVNPGPETPHNPLVILIGSQRGLCGNFNTVLFLFFEKMVALKPHLPGGTIPIIPVGKKAVQYVDDNPLCTSVAQYPELNAKTLPIIAHNILELLLKNNPPFTNVSVLSNVLKTFFVQKPEETILIPFMQTKIDTVQATSRQEDFYWEQSPHQLLDQLVYQTLETQLHYLLFESLLAEHAARFISMDNATRNAQSLMEENQLQYNKLRQTKITKELAELVSSL